MDLGKNGRKWTQTWEYKDKREEIDTMRTPVFDQAGETWAGVGDKAGDSLLYSDHLKTGKPSENSGQTEAKHRS